jgi:hypothetical protein
VLKEKETSKEKSLMKSKPKWPQVPREGPALLLSLLLVMASFVRNDIGCYMDQHFNSYIFILINSNWEKYPLPLYLIHNFMEIITGDEAIFKKCLKKNGQ